MQKVAYAACSRGREGIEVFVESVADLLQIQNRTGDRKASVEMAFEPDQNDRRAEVKRLFRHLQRIRAAKETVEHAQTVDLCRQAAETLEPGKDQKQSVDLQEHGIRSAREGRQTRRAARPACDPPKRKNARKGEPWASSQGCEDNHDPFKSVQVVRECPVPGSV